MWTFLTEQFHKGGPVMWPLLAAGFLAVVFVLERVWTYVRVPRKRKAEERMREAERIVQEQGVEGAMREFVRRWGLFHYVFLAVLGRYEGLRMERRREEDLEAELVRIGDEATREYLGRFLTVLSTIGSVAPLLGLLGTILGMIRAFSAIARAGVGDPTVVASGISEALITTATGLMIAIPTIVLHRYLSVKAGRMLRKVEVYTHGFVYVLLEGESGGEKTGKRENGKTGGKDRGMVGEGHPFLDERDTPDLTSLIDCVFLLLIFFMVTTALLSTKGINVTLPGAMEESPAAPAARDLNIILREDGVIEVSGERTTIEDFVPTLQSVMRGRGSTNAILLADRSIPYKQVVKVMDLARGAGIEHIAFASE